MAGTDEHPRWCKGPVVERNTGKMGRKMEAEGKAQDLVCIPGSDLVTGHKERDVTAGDRKCPQVIASFISKAVQRQLAVDFFVFFPNKVGPFLPCSCRLPGLSGTQVDAVSGKGYLAFYGLVKRCPEAIMSAHKKRSEIYIYAL